jgi:hypothetical protein
MKTEQDSCVSFDDAVAELIKEGIEAKREAFGFSITIDDNNENLYMECGLERNGDISLSVFTGAPPVQWYFRPDIPPMIELLLNAHKRLVDSRSKTWISALQDENNHYKKTHEQG